MTITRPVRQDIFLSTLPLNYLTAVHAVMAKKGWLTPTEKQVLAWVDQEITHRRQLVEEE